MGTSKTWEWKDNWTKWRVTQKSIKFITWKRKTNLIIKNQSFREIERIIREN